MLSRDAAAMSRQAAREIMIAQGTGWLFPTSHAQYVFVMLLAAAYYLNEYERPHLLRGVFRYDAPIF